MCAESNSSAWAITGAGGFIGTRLQRHLRDKNQSYSPVRLRNSGTKPIREMLEQSKDQGLQTVIHLGWPASSTMGYKDSLENMEAAHLSAELAEMCVSLGIHFLGFGSPAEFFYDGTEYSKAKLRTRARLNDLVGSNLITWLRPHYVFDETTWPLFVREASSGKNVQIYDDSEKLFIHIDDVVSAIRTAAEKPILGEVDIAPLRPTRPSKLLSSLGLEYTVVQKLFDKVATNHLQVEALLLAGWRPDSTEALLSS